MTSTIVVSVRLDIRDLATLGIFMERSHIKPSSRGHICREMLELMANHVRNSEGSLTIDSPSGALQILKAMGIGIGEGKRGMLSPSLLKGVHLEEGFTSGEGENTLIKKKAIRAMAKEIGDNLNSNVDVLRRDLSNAPLDVVDSLDQKLNEGEGESYGE